jgi:hypothetical protein
MANKHNNPTREEILRQENQLLKEILGLESQLDEVEAEPERTEDMFAGLRKLALPPKVDASFYIGKMPSPWSVD